jgi:PhnB protein
MKQENLPAGCSGVSPYLVVDDADAALAFYEKAFGMTDVKKMAGPDGKTVHGEINWAGSIIMVGTSMGQPMGRIEGNSPISLYVCVENCDKTYERAIAAGCTEKRKPADQFYGDRTCAVTDPFGFSWGFGQRVKNMSFEEMEKAMHEMMKAPK